MKIIITGATGLIGAETVRAAIADQEITSIVLLVRSQSTLKHPKLTIVQHSDFLSYAGLEKYFAGADAVAWCLGISQTQVNAVQYHVITYDFVKCCAEFCLQVNPGIRFLFVSGDGADRTEKSRTLFKRIKGKAENYLLQCGLPNVIIARPDAVRPKHKNPKAPFAYKLVYPLFPLVAFFTPNKIIWSDVLGRALVWLLKKGFGGSTHENVELKKLGQTQPA